MSFDVLNPRHLVVIDRFSSDGTQETLKRYADSILKVFELNIDLAIARRIGGLMADAEIVCYVDDDVIISPRFKAIISRLMECFTFFFCVKRKLIEIWNPPP